MNKNFGILISLLIVLAVIIVGYSTKTNDKVVDTTIVSDYKNATYHIQGKSVTLKNGLAEEEAAPGSATKIVTKFFGNEVKHDFDKDGREDVAFLLTQDMGGSGTFYYVVIALNKENGYVGSDAAFLGDRIAPQTTEMGKGDIVVVNYADRAPGESFATQPSVGKSMNLLLDVNTLQIGEVAKDFEGEAGAKMMKLDMKPWGWITTKYTNGKEMKPRDTKRFTLTFKSDGTFSAQTDCNSIGGKYVISGQSIVLSQMMSTEMYCEGSQESEYSKMLGDVEKYSFTSRGELVFKLKQNLGESIYR